MVHGAYPELRNILLVFELLDTIPPTSVLCETSFSQMKLIKTARRAKLSRKSLNNLMMVKLQAPSICDFSPDDAIAKWYTTVSKFLLDLK